MKKIATQQNLSFYEDVKSILQLARDNAYKSVNFIMVEAYWNIGKKIVQEEQNGNDRAEYGTYLIKELSAQLTAEFGKGFSVQSLWNMRQFYNAFPILSTLWRELSWSHYKLVIRIENQKAREWYIKDSIDKIVDVACGTGDMMDFWKKRSEVNGVAVGEIVGVDPSTGMVGVAREKFPKFNYHIAKATEIPLQDESAEILSITYGIRNVVEREAALKSLTES